MGLSELLRHLGFLPELPVGAATFSTSVLLRGLPKHLEIRSLVTVEESVTARAWAEVCP